MLLHNCSWLGQSHSSTDAERKGQISGSHPQKPTLPKASLAAVCFILQLPFGEATCSAPPHPRCMQWQQLLWSWDLLFCSNPVVLTGSRKLECIASKQSTRSLLSKYFSWITNKIILLLQNTILWSLIKSISLIQVSCNTPMMLHKDMIWCSTMNKYYLHRAALISAQLSVASIFCCLPKFFFNRSFHSVEIHFKGFCNNTLHFQILKNGNFFILASLIFYQKHLVDKRQRKQTDRWIKYKGQRKWVCGCSLFLSKNSFKAWPDSLSYCSHQ